MWKKKKKNYTYIDETCLYMYRMILQYIKKKNILQYIEIMYYSIAIAFGVSFNPNLQSQSHWSLFNRTW